MKRQDPQHICPLCPKDRPKRFAERPQLNRHLHTHTRQSSRSVHECPYPNCAHGFIHRGHLNRHLAAKHGGEEKPAGLEDAEAKTRLLKDAKEQAALNLSLVEAVCQGKIEEVQSLVEEGAEINFDVEPTALEAALGRGHLDIARYLHTLGARLTKDQLEHGLYTAVGMDDDEAVQNWQLWGAGCDGDREPLYRAVIRCSDDQGGEDALRRLMLKHNIDIKALGSSSRTMESVWRRASLNTIRALINCGLDLNPTDCGPGKTPLVQAFQQRWDDAEMTVKLLLQHGALPSDEIIRAAEKYAFSESRRAAIRVMRLAKEKGEHLMETAT
jgi:hypothetical protein